VAVRLGELSGVDPDLLKSAYELVRETTICAGAPLAITTVAAQWACRQCASPVPAGGPLRCPACGAPARLVSGDEILLERLDLEVPDV
jgi:hydrogenase nickel incorporation protein HypA/HybF